MKTLLAFVALLPLSHVGATTFNCTVKYNYETVFTVKFELENSKSKKFGSFEEYEFTLKDTGKNFELELYNSLEPSRTYAVGDLTKSPDLGLIIWNREKLMEVNCQKKI